jgi:hypothetical protein
MTPNDCNNFAWAIRMARTINAGGNLIPDLVAYREEIEARKDKEALESRMDMLSAVMVSVDKWFDEGDLRLKQDECNRAADAREIALKAIEHVAAERGARRWRGWMP